MSVQINIKLDPSVAERLNVLAAKTGRSKTFYASEAIEEHLEEYEDHFLAKDALDEFRQSDDQAIPHEDMDWDQLGR